MDAIYIPEAYQDAEQECGSEHAPSWEFSQAQEELDFESKSGELNFMSEDQDIKELSEFDGIDADNEERCRNKSCSISRLELSQPLTYPKSKFFVSQEFVREKVHLEYLNLEDAANNFEPVGVDDAQNDIQSIKHSLGSLMAPLEEQKIEVVQGAGELDDALV